MASLSQLAPAISAAIIVGIFILLQPLLMRIPCYSARIKSIGGCANQSVTHAIFWRAYWQSMFGLHSSLGDRRQVLLSCVQSAFDRVVEHSTEESTPRQSGSMRCKGCAGRVPCAAFDPECNIRIASTATVVNTHSPASENAASFCKARLALWGMVAERRRQSEQMVPTFSSPSSLLHSPAAVKESLGDANAGCCMPSSTAFFVRTQQQTIACGNCKRVLHAGCMREYLQRAITSFRERSLDELQRLLLATASPPCHLCCEQVGSLNSLPALAGPGGSRGRGKKASPHVALRITDDYLTPPSSTDYVPTQSQLRKQQKRRVARASAKCTPVLVQLHARDSRLHGRERSTSVPLSGGTQSSAGGDPSCSQPLTTELV